MLLNTGLVAPARAEAAVLAGCEDRALTIREHRENIAGVPFRAVVSAPACLPDEKRHVREVNERILQREEAMSGVSQRFVAFVCECLSAGCTARVEMTIEEYRERARPALRFLVAGGHADPCWERVAEVNERFTIVQRFSAA